MLRTLSQGAARRFRASGVTRVLTGSRWNSGGALLAPLGSTKGVRISYGNRALSATRLSTMPTAKHSLVDSLNRPLSEVDPEMAQLIEDEKKRMWHGLEMIASENITSKAVLEANGSIFTNKYSEGQPGARYYGGNEVIDKVELLCKKRALEAFSVDSETWGVNVQPYSGSTANWAAYVGLINPHDRIMGLDLPSGGHLTHGYQTAKRKISATSIFFESFPYTITEEGHIDYDNLEASAAKFHPKIIVCGASAYPRDWDYARLRAIADKNSALLMCDMAHYSGLVATKEHNSPFEFCDVVTTTTHKTLRGPRSGMIFFRKVAREGSSAGELAAQLESKIDFAVFPSVQGGPHNHTIAGVAVALKQAAEPEFKEYIQAVKANAKSLASSLKESGNTLVTNGTDNHLVLWNLRPHGITGSKLEEVLEAAHISTNKNTIVGDKSAISPGGLRLGTPALTSRGMDTEDMKTVAAFLMRGVKIAQAIQESHGRKMVTFRTGIVGNPEIEALRAEVTTFSKTFGVPGFDVADLAE